MIPSRWKIVTYALIILTGFVVAAPNLFDARRLAALPDWLPKRQVTLGLDLKGGSHVVLELDVAALTRDHLDALGDKARGALRDARIQATLGKSADAVTVRVDDPARRAEAQRVLQALVSTVSLSALTEPQRDLDLALLPDGTIALRPTEAALLARKAAAADQSLEIIRYRIDDRGIAEPTIQRVGPDRILVQLPGVQDPEQIRKILRSMAKLTFHRVLDPALAQAGLPAGYHMLPASNGTTAYAVERQPMLQGDRLADAAAGFDPRTGQPVVNFRFDRDGTRRFAEITRAHLGTPFAIVLDGKVLSAPVIQEPITGGSGQISGAFSVKETVTLAGLLRAGALPVPLQIVEERIVGADLGSDAIRTGAITGLAGLALVLGFMIALYGKWGLVANLALLINVALTFAALTLLGATLTLPGIAGIVLGIGLAVDANVLINERIREETRKGKGAAVALEAGFARAYATIVDSNATALIATALLFGFGSGPVRGFAVTMGLGIAISMFTAVAVVRAIMAAWLHWRRPKQFIIAPLVRVPRWSGTPGFRYMRARFLGIGVSLVLSLASIGLLVKPGLNYGIDFVGGILIEAKGPRADLGALRTALDRLGLGEIALQESGDAVLVRIARQPGDEAAQDAAIARARTTIAQAQPDVTFARTEVVGPKVSGELARAGILAVALASLAMLGYIWARFEWPFAVGAIVTLALDVTKVAGFLVLTGIDFNLTAIAALLTLIGYSVNDKVVVYDRMRENMRLYKAMPLRDLIDRSINETLARSLYTSITALLAIAPMAAWGGPAVASFALPMAFGIVVAASSSIFIAAPILLFLGDWRTRRTRRAANTAAPPLMTAADQ